MVRRPSVGADSMVDATVATTYNAFFFSSFCWLFGCRCRLIVLSARERVRHRGG